MCEFRTHRDGSKVVNEKVKDCGIPSCPMSDANAK